MNKPAKFRSRPVEVEALQFAGTIEGHRLVDAFLSGSAEHEHFDDGNWSFDPDEGLGSGDDHPDLTYGGCIDLTDHRGRVTTALPGDWFVKTGTDTFGIRPKAVFGTEYEPAE